MRRAKPHTSMLIRTVSPDTSAARTHKLRGHTIASLRLSIYLLFIFQWRFTGRPMEARFYMLTGNAAF